MREMREIVKRGYEEGDYLKFYRLVEEMEEYPLAKANIDRMTAFLQNEDTGPWLWSRDST
jgi:hypothetical protein